jgi:hypothetical protein
VLKNSDRIALAPHSYVGNSAAGFGERVRTAIFSLRFLGCHARKKWRLVFRLDFLVLFHQGKRTIKNAFGYFLAVKSIVKTG